ncbi:MAG TPA: extracellular solute-binding protein [Clostridia bacterium]|nr:extracellular solute-binding protein [Clostridia bacterium]HOM34437.1 extracellular solute-binding protein [Clostridia bacterium]HOT70597.1 extracellular solute-binding protein [Clostridia bacterium]HPL08925.1 extracellular solute-binding protein [Clostridia bacterium]HQG00647.1 extracellular solute-binding protein [Clostridia bacterium]
MNKMKLISLVLCLVLVCSFVFTACDKKPTETATQQPTETSTQTETPTETQIDTTPAVVEKPAVMDITTLYYYGDATENAAEKLAYKNYLNRHYGFTINIHAHARDMYIETINLRAVSGDLTGIVRLFAGTDGIKWYQEGIVLAIDEFLADNEVWNTIVPEHWKETFSYDGAVYGLAFGGDGTPSWFSRTMRGDWLDAVGMSRPSTIDEFYEVSKAFTYNDPDKNGDNDTWGFCSRHVWLMQDIFKAYGCTPNWESALVPVWNPRDDIWEDPVIKPVMADACTFLRKCYVEGIIHPELFSMSSTNVRNLMSNGHAGSCFYWDHWLIVWENAVKKTVGSHAYMVAVGALSGVVTHKINCWKTEIGSPYVLMANTAQPKEVINWFINLAYGTAEDFFTFRYGIPQTDKKAKTGFLLDGMTVYLLHFKADDQGSVTSSGCPALVGGHPGYALDIGEYGYKSAYYSGNPTWDSEQVTVTAANLQRRFEVFNEFNDGRLYLLTGDYEQPTNPEYTNNMTEWNKAGRLYVSSVMVDGVDTTTALKTYLDTVMAFDPQTTLDFMNAKLGKTSNQDYRKLWNSLN